MTFGNNFNLKSYIKDVIAETKSKYQEEAIIRKEIELLTKEIHNKQIDETKIEELLIRIFYCHILGFNIEQFFGFVVQNTQLKSLNVKRICFEICQNCIPEDSQFRILVVSQIQKELESSCVLNKIIGLNALYYLINKKNYSAFLEHINKLIKPNEQAAIRRKALLVYEKLVELIPDYQEEFLFHLKEQLKEKDLQIVSSAVALLLKKVNQNNLFEYKQYQNILIEVMSEIIDQENFIEELKNDSYDQPFILLNVLQIFQVIAKGDLEMSEKLYPLIYWCLSQMELITTDLDVSIIQQLLITLYEIYPNKELIDWSLQSFDLLYGSDIILFSNKLLVLLQIIDKAIENDHILQQSFQLVIVEALQTEDQILQIKACEILIKTVKPESFANIFTQVKKVMNQNCLNSDGLKLMKKLYQKLEQISLDSLFYLENSLQIILEIQDNDSSQIKTSIINNLNELIDNYDPNEIRSLVVQILIIFQQGFIVENQSLTFYKVFAFFVSKKFNEILEAIGEQNCREMFEMYINLYGDIQEKQKFVIQFLFDCKIQTQNENIKSFIQELLFKIQPQDSQSSMDIFFFTNIKQPLKQLQINEMENILDDYISQNLTLDEYEDNYLQNQLQIQQENKVEQIKIKYTPEEKEKQVVQPLENIKTEFVYKGKKVWSEEGIIEETENKQNQDEQIQQEKVDFIDNSQVLQVQQPEEIKQESSNNTKNTSQETKAQQQKAQMLKSLFNNFQIDNKLKNKFAKKNLTSKWQDNTIEVSFEQNQITLKQFKENWTSNQYTQILEFNLRSYKTLDQLINILQQQNISLVDKENNSCAFATIFKEESVFIYSEYQKEKYSFTVKSNSKETNIQIQQIISELLQ